MRIHSKATTNIKQREQIRRSSQSYRTLANQYRVSIATIHRWKHRDTPDDRSARPKEIYFALNPEEERMVLFLRQSGLSLDDILDSLTRVLPNLGRSNLYRLLRRHGLNKLPSQSKASKSSKFKDYEPGYLHIDFFHLPGLDSKKHYCFVAIDRATRLMYLKVYETKNKQVATDFLGRCLEFFPFRINTVLTDNGGEFNNRFYKKRQGIKANLVHPFEELCRQKRIEYRNTRPLTPKTNGLVERVIGLIQEGTTKRHRYPSAEDMLKGVQAWFVYYNFYRPHRRIGRMTPYAKACQWHEKNPDLFIKEPNHLQNYCSQCGET
jgi:transposase InsO family protein